MQCVIGANDVFRTRNGLWLRGRCRSTFCGRSTSSGTVLAKCCQCAREHHQDSPKQLLVHTFSWNLGSPILFESNLFQLVEQSLIADLQFLSGTATIPTSPR